MKIPIQNIYYLLCYAWDALEERNIVRIQQDKCRSYADLFARVLESGVTHLLKRGLDRGYITEEEDTSSFRGKFDVSNTIKHNCLQQARVHCRFDTLSYDVTHNRIIKKTIGRLVRCNDLDRGLRNRLLGVYRRLRDIAAIDLSPNIFGRVTLHRNNAFYGFLLHVCRLIYDCLLVDETSGEMTFRDFLRDEAAMARLFERFVYNFFYREQDIFHVKRETIDWQDVTAEEEQMPFLPKMRTDVSMVSKDRHIVLDTKYTVHTLQSFRASETVKSSNLYQLFAYLKNLRVVEKEERQVEGILLYPTVSKTLDLEYVIQGHRVRIATLDLNTGWSEIAQRLLGLLN